LVLGTALAILVFGIGESVFFAYNDKGLHRPAAFLGVLVSVQGIGGLLGGLTAAPVIKRIGEVATVGLGLGLFVPFYLGGAIRPSLWVAVPTVILAGFGLPYLIVAFQTLMQRVTPGELMGRTSAAVDALISGPQALSLGLGAILVGLVDYRILLAIMSAVVTVAAAWVLSGRKLSPPALPGPDALIPEPASAASGTAK